MKYKVICYPSVDEYECEVEADSEEEARKEAEETARRNCYFYADKIEEIEEE